MIRTIGINHLTNEHIQYVLGVELPLLHEAVDANKQREILLKQYLFEAWYYDLMVSAGLFEEASGLLNEADPYEAGDQLEQQMSQFLGRAGQAVSAGGQAISAGYDQLKQAAAQRLQSIQARAAKYGLTPSAIASKVKQKFTGSIGNVKSLAQALTLLFQYPTLVHELEMELTGEIIAKSSPLIQFAAELRDKLKQTENESVRNNKLYDSLVKTTDFVVNSLNYLTESYRALKGWVSVAVGLIVYPLIKNIVDTYTKTIDQIKSTFILKTLGVKMLAAKTAALAYGSGKAAEKIDNQDVQPLAEIDFKSIFQKGSQKAEEKTANIIKAKVDTQIQETFKLLTDIAKKLSQKAIKFIVTKAATMGIAAYLGAAATFAGGFAMVANIAAPIVTKFIARYNQVVSREAEGRRARTTGMGGALSQQVPTTQKIAMSQPVQALQRFGRSIGLAENEIKLIDILYS